MATKPKSMNLGELRIVRGVSQVQLAARLDVHQPAVSRLESRPIDNVSVGTIQRYIAALGGRLELVARFGGARVMIQL